jgi:hypothetical protein
MIFGFSPNTNDEKESKVPLTKDYIEEELPVWTFFFLV